MKKFFLMFFAVVTLAGMLAISGCKKKVTYTVTFNPNGGAGTMTAQTFTEGEAQALTRNAFTYDGYSFSGWNTVQGGSGASYTDGQTITATVDMTLYAQWTLNNPLNGHTWVDLGLPSGTKWAICNVGATSPEGYGDYFALGETMTKETYNCSTYRYCNGDYNTFTKYCSDASGGYNGFTDNLTTLQSSDDAATANWGAGWRMPTREEMNELYSNCTHEWTTQNGVSGRKFTGSNGNSIFLPAAGNRYGRELYDAGSDGEYWSSSLNTGAPSEAWILYFESDYYDVLGGHRDYGFTVRAVCQSQN